MNPVGHMLDAGSNHSRSSRAAARRGRASARRGGPGSASRDAPAGRAEATVGIWSADYPSASDFLDLFFRCSDFSLTNAAATRNGSFFCDPAADRLMNRADSEQATNPQRAHATWAAADRAVTYSAPRVILASLENIDFLSARVSNYQYNPVLDVLLDQLEIHGRQRNAG